MKSLKSVDDLPSWVNLITMGLHLLTRADLKASDFERLKTGEYESYGALKKSWMLTPSIESKAKKLRFSKLEILTT